MYIIRVKKDLFGYYVARIHDSDYDYSLNSSFFLSVGITFSSVINAASYHINYHTCETLKSFFNNIFTCFKE